jgi:hypothetical protein
MPNKKGKRKAKAAAKRQRSVVEVNEALLSASKFNIISSNDDTVMSGQAAIAAGANVNYSRDGLSCLISACFHDHAKMVAMLLNAGADKDAKDEKGFTALLVAAENGHAKCIKLLLNAGADKNATNNENSTALMMAAVHGHIQCIKCLLKAGCDVNTLNKHGGSALFAAVLENHVDCTRTLVRYGADISIKIDGQSFDDIADENNNSVELKAALRVQAKKRRRCEQCGTTKTGQLKCGACLTTYYCNRECQVANWPLHKQVCSAVDE